MRLRVRCSNSGSSMNNSEQLILAIKASHIGFYDWNIQTGKMFFSEQMLADWGMNNDPQTLEYVVNLIHVDDRERVKTEIEKTVAEGGNYNIDYRVVQPTTGKTVWFNVLGQVHKDENGQPQRFIGTCLNITDRKLAEENLKKREIELSAEKFKLEQIFQASPAAMAIWRGENLIFDRVNPQYQALFPSRPLLGLPLLDAIPEISGQGFDILIKEVMRTGKSHFESEALVRHKREVDGEIEDRYYTYIYVPIFDQDNTAYAVYDHAVDVTEQVISRRRLKESEWRYRTLTETLPQLVWTCKPDGSCDYLSKQWTEYTGISEILQLGLNWLDQVIHPDDRERVSKHWTGAVRGDHPYDIEYRIRRYDGEYKWFKTRGTAIRNDLGEIIYWFGTSTDIQDSKLIEQRLVEVNENLEKAVEERTKELSESYRFSESVLENIPHMIFVKDAKDLKFVSFNKAGEKLLGVSRDQLIGKSDHDFFDNEEAKRFQSKDRQVLEGTEAFDIPDEEITTPHGIRTLHTKKIPIYDDGGHPKYLVGISEDITERKRLEAERFQLIEANISRQEELKAAERLSFLAEASAALTSSLNLEEILKSLTKVSVPSIADWCAVQMLDEKGKLKQVAVAHSDPEKVKWAWELNSKYPTKYDSPIGAPNVLRTKISEYVEEIPLELLRSAAVDEEHWKIIEEIGFFSYICAPIKVSGEVIGVLTLVTTQESRRRFSSSDLRLAEELCTRAGIAIENSRLFREAQGLNRVKDEFLATLSHELRTPINVIQGHADLLMGEMESLSTDELKKSLATIQRNTRLQTQIVADLLDVSSIITGKIAYVPQVISPAEVAAGVASAIKQTAETKGVSIHFKSDSAPSKFMADPTRLHQIIWNLANNAVKFTPSGGSVTLEVKQDDNDCVFEVTDTGIGIKEEFLPYVFDRFRQADSSMTRKYGGLGLGLSIVKSLVEIHGGTVQVRSAGHGEGATFTVRLPIITGYSYSAPQIAREEAIRESEALPEVSLQGIKILLVEDSVDNRELVVRLLKKRGAEVLTAESAQQAREVLSREKPDLILSDIGMPDENGLEFMRRYRSEQPSSKIPAIALTAYVRPQEIADAINAGFQSHIAKPISPKSLAAEIAKTLQKNLH